MSLSEPPYSFADGVLTITGDVTIKMKDGTGSTSQRIVVAEDSTVVLDGVEINASGDYKLAACELGDLNYPFSGR